LAAQVRVTSPGSSDAAGIVKGGRLTQVSIARSFSKKFFDDYKTQEVTAQNVRASLISRRSSQSNHGTHSPGTCQFPTPDSMGLNENDHALFEI
jgi:hypothetical protein